MNERQKSRSRQMPRHGDVRGVQAAGLLKQKPGMRPEEGRGEHGGGSRRDAYQK